MKDHRICAEGRSVQGKMNFLLILLALITLKGEIMQEGLRVIYEPAQQVDFLYSKDGANWYPVATMRNPRFRQTEEDTFYWVFPGSKWSGGRLKVVFYDGEKMEEREVALVKEEESQATGPEFIREAKNSHSPSLLTPSLQEEDPYAWRMLGYDAQHTGYYPHPLAPPLEEKWSFYALYNNFHMISASCANECLYVGNGGRRLYALDIYSGDTLWVQWLTSNVWTTALSPGDTLLFAGTSIEPTLTWPTFFCLDARTGDVRWSEHLATVEFQPIGVDSAVYLTNLQGAIYAFSTRGVELWEIYAPLLPVSLGSPAYWQKKVFIGGENCALLALDSYAGDTVWIFPTSGWIDCTPMIYDGAVHFFSDGYLHALDAQSGGVLWRHYAFIPGPIPRPIAHEEKLYYNTYSRVNSEVYAIIHCLNPSNGESLWESPPLSGGAINGMVITSNELFWSSSTQYLYALRAEGGDILFQEETSEENWQCWFWPIIYKDHILIAGDRVTAYQGQIPVDSTPGIFVFPNPTQDIVNIQIQLPEASEVKIGIYNLLGALVRSLHWDELPQGTHTLFWDGRDSWGRRASSNIYFILIRIGGERQKTAKLIYLRR